MPGKQGNVAPRQRSAQGPSSQLSYREELHRIADEVPFYLAPVLSVCVVGKPSAIDAEPVCKGRRKRPLARAERSRHSRTLPVSAVKFLKPLVVNLVGPRDRSSLTCALLLNRDCQAESNRKRRSRPHQEAGDPVRSRRERTAHLYALPLDTQGPEAVFQLPYGTRNKNRHLILSCGVIHLSSPPFDSGRHDADPWPVIK